jgi:microcystin-dependent protein
VSNPFLGEIRIVSFNFPPKGWAFCDGQFLPINQNQPLFAILGTTYGGNGQTTFALPDLQGRAPMQEGQGNGLSQRFLGEMSGSETVTLLTSEMPSHNHIANGSNTQSTQQSPIGNFSSGSTQNKRYAAAANNPDTQMNQSVLAPTGGSLPHNNMPPYLFLNFIIALQGVYPPRT